LTGNVTGTVLTATQNSITTMTGLVTTSALNSGSITSGFGNIDVGASSIAAGSFDASDGNITNVGNIALDSLTSDGNSITITPTTDTLFANGTGVVIGHTAQLGNYGQDNTGSEFQIIGTASTDTTQAIVRFSDGTEGGRLIFAHSNNGTVGTHVPLDTGDDIGEIQWAGTDTSGFHQSAAEIKAIADGAHGTNYTPGALVFGTNRSSSGATNTDVIEAMRIDALGRVFIGDTTIGTSVDMDTAGLVINQAAGDKQILAFKSSDVGHGMTTLTETDTYGFFGKDDADGGLTIKGFKDAGGQNYHGLYMRGTQGEAASTTKSTSGRGVVAIDATIKNGTGQAILGSNQNILSISTADTVRFIFDAEGDFYSDASINADYYDDYNDPVLVRDLDLAITQRFDQWTKYNRADIEKAKLAHFDKDGKPFVNWTKVWKLHNGAIWQLNEKIEMLIEENKVLKESISKMLPEG